MGFYPLLRTTWVCWTPLPLEDALRRLEGAVGDGRMTGTIEVETFALQHRVPGVRNSWRPRLHGTLIPSNGGTRVEVKLSVHPFVAVFTFLHGLFLLGLSWLLGIGAFSWEVGKATAALTEVLEATAVGEEAVAAALPVADPTEPGAEARAPYRLRAESSPDGARFRVPGPRLWSRTIDLEASATGVTLDVSGPPLFLPWDQLSGCDLAVGDGGAALVFLGEGRSERHREPTGLSEADALWLATWLDAQARRRALPERDARARDAERARLAALVRDRRPE